MDNFIHAARIAVTVHTNVCESEDFRYLIVIYYIWNSVYGNRRMNYSSNLCNHTHTIHDTRITYVVLHFAKNCFCGSDREKNNPLPDWAGLFIYGRTFICRGAIQIITSIRFNYSYNFFFTCVRSHTQSLVRSMIGCRTPTAQMFVRAVCDVRFNDLHHGHSNRFIYCCHYSLPRNTHTNIIFIHVRFVLSFVLLELLWRHINVIFLAHWWAEQWFHRMV